ncbi:MAG: hypothetical protein LC746_08315 [Acidobacteria bacterium]|nr:hypothetical protein [Acidobacteriota bacterium]
MFCPQCGANQSDDLKFCNLCGANLQAVRQAVASRDAGEKLDWSKTWVAEMFLSETERKRRLEELERERGITPEVKRYNEIKAGVITSCVGVAVALFLSVLFDGIVASGKVTPSDAQILRNLWIAGVIPFFVGLALIINGVFVSKQLARALERRQADGASLPADQQADTRTLRPADTTEFVPASFSVTEQTTRHLNDVSREQ